MKFGPKLPKDKIIDSINIGAARAAISAYYGLDCSAIMKPTDMPAAIFSEETRGIYWCMWDDWNYVSRSMWVLCSNGFFVYAKRVDYHRGKIEVNCNPHGCYTNAAKHFYIYFPLPKYNQDGTDMDGLGRINTPVHTGYRKAISDMAKLLAYGVRMEEAFEVSFRGKSARSYNIQNLTLQEIIKRPDLVEELKVELKEAFKAKGIDEDWLVSRLQEIGENQDHKQQMDVLMMIGRVLGVGLDNFSSPDGGRGNDGSSLLMGYSSRRSIGPGETPNTIEEAVMVGPSESVRAALGQSNE